MEAPVALSRQPRAGAGRGGEAPCSPSNHKSRNEYIQEQQRIAIQDKKNVTKLHACPENKELLFFLEERGSWEDCSKQKVHLKKLGVLHVVAAPWLTPWDPGMQALLATRAGCLRSSPLMAVTKTKALDIKSRTRQAPLQKRKLFHM